MTNIDSNYGDQRDEDRVTVWSAAANCLLYEEDPGPKQVNIGSIDEPRWVSRSYAWQDFYAHLLIDKLDGDRERLATAADAMRAALAEHTPSCSTLLRRLVTPG